jgi:3'(2'), 5'-bisphosphate nucleotidase
MTHPDLETLLPHVVAIASEAGEAILDVYEGADVTASYKDDRSPLTQADLASHGLIAMRLWELAPDIPLLSEEAKATPYPERKGWPLFWLVDPLDGTKEFLKRNGEFTVNIALIGEGRPILGVVHAPVPRTSYAAAEGLGAFKKRGKNTTAIKVQAAEGTLKVVASRSHAGPETEAFLTRLSASYPLDVLSIGSSLKLCLVAEGAAQLYPRFGPTMEWDTAAAQCVVEEAGGRVLDLQGERLGYNKESLLNPFFVVAGDAALDWRAFLSASVKS